MGKRFDLIVFDWDGTLMDSTRAIVVALQAACADLGLETPSEGDCRYVIGLDLNSALRRVAPALTADRLPEMLDRYRHHYLARDHDLSPFPGIGELLADLDDGGFLLAVATGKSRLGLDRALANTGFGARFAASRCADECHSKPHPQMLEELLDELEIRPERALMIGDTTHDLQMAINAGVPGLAVAYGAHDDGELRALAPLACLHSVEQLGDWLRRNA